MPKKIVILSDGTWQSAHKPLNGRPSNVVLLSRLIKPVDANGTRQIVFYDPGVGTGAGFWNCVLGGAFGMGLDLNISECYRFIVQNFQPRDDDALTAPDELYFMGFSRGAYTVRCLAGMIRKCGILRREHLLKYNRAVELYRDRKMHPDDEVPKNFRRQMSVPESAIRFVGVFDTVGTDGVAAALGFKWTHKRYRFHDAELSSSVQIGAQALAIDEKRRQFGPVPWIEPPPTKGHAVIQRWFTGCHSDIGGGEKGMGLSNITLHWMASQAQDAGLAIDMKLLTDEYPRDALAPIHESRRLHYRLVCPLHRTPGQVDAHVQQRWKQDHSYRPPKLKLDLLD